MTRQPIPITWITDPRSHRRIDNQLGQAHEEAGIVMVAVQLPEDAWVCDACNADITIEQPVDRNAPAGHPDSYPRETRSVPVLAGWALCDECYIRWQFNDSRRIEPEFDFTNQQTCDCAACITEPVRR